MLAQIQIAMRLRILKESRMKRGEWEVKTDESSSTSVESDDSITELSHFGSDRIDSQD